jgi:hypothetical protein
VVGHANCRARMSQDQFVPTSLHSVRPRFGTIEPLPRRP